MSDEELNVLVCVTCSAVQLFSTLVTTGFACLTLNCALSIPCLLPPGFTRLRCPCLGIFIFEIFIVKEANCCYISSAI